jgi:hypothetical protein
MKLATALTLALLGLCAAGCKDAAEAAGSEPKKTGAESTASAASTSKPQASAQASGAPAAPPLPPGVAAVRAGKLTNPATKSEVKLVETSLDKCYGFKGYSMMLPEGTTLQTLVGARACAAFMPDSKKKFGFIVMTDEIKVKMWKRTDLENVKKKHLDEPDAFVYEVEQKGKTRLTGWLEKKIGPYNVQCNSMSDAGTTTLDDELAAIEVCRTVKYEEKK